MENNLGFFKEKISELFVVTVLKDWEQYFVKEIRKILIQKIFSQKFLS